MLSTVRSTAWTGIDSLFRFIREVRAWNASCARSNTLIGTFAFPALFRTRPGLQAYHGAPVGLGQLLHSANSTVCLPRTSFEGKLIRRQGDVIIALADLPDAVA